MQSLEDNQKHLEARICAACTAAGRPRADVTLIGVSKTKPIAAVKAAAALGITDLGENYLDEAVTKIEACAELGVTWHFIGRIQSNKTRTIAQHFDWVHTIDRYKIAQRLNDQCPPDKTLNVLVQVNIDADPAKGGASTDGVQALINSITALPKLRVRGLMTILARDTDPGAGYRSMAQLFEQLRLELDSQHQPLWDTLSMGMTADLEQAIAAGSTHIRIGTALFGARDT